MLIVFEESIFREYFVISDSKRFVSSLHQHLPVYTKNFTELLLPLEDTAAFSRLFQISAIILPFRFAWSVCYVRDHFVDLKANPRVCFSVYSLTTALS